MASESMPKFCSFQQIKGRLDPCCVYVVFEKAANAGDRSEFHEVNDLLEPYRTRILAQELYYDDASAKLFMVIKLDPRSAPALQEILLQPKLPRNVVVYMYGNLAP